MARGLAVGDSALGAIAGAFGFARLITNVPAGLFITHRLHLALFIGAGLVSLGIVCMGFGQPYALLIAGRGLCGMGHSITLLAGITAILRFTPHNRRGRSLAAYDMSSMLGVLGGMLLVGYIPAGTSWNVALLLASAPQFVSLALTAAAARTIPRDPGAIKPFFSRGSAHSDSHTRRKSLSEVALLAFFSGFAIALAWSSVGHFILPLRADRDFHLDREGVAWLLAIPQVVDVLAVVPTGALGDRTSHSRLLGVTLLLLAAGVISVAFGPLHAAVAGCVLFGLGLAGWMLPVALLNSEASTQSASWRTSLYRVAVDLGVFLGPVLAGLFAGIGLVEPFVAVMAAFIAALGFLSLLRGDKLRRDGR